MKRIKQTSIGKMILLFIIAAACFTAGSPKAHAWGAWGDPILWVWRGGW